MALDIKPTRSELINLKRRIKQTKNGYNLLKMKRDGLFHEFRNLLADMIQAKKDLTSAFILAKGRIDLANSIEGALKVRSAAIANSTHPEVMVEPRNIMGVVVPSVSGTNLKQSLRERGIGFVGSSPYVDEAADSFGDLIIQIVKASEMEATLKRLLAEIEATKRRVNALEHKVIPELEEARVFIQLRLEEMEREETFRLKRFKNK
ncbi:MAG: V-type ATP synthase subunit D [Candidatus Poseidoniales archaeon]|jgi:V/A-type H+-transporting ATPase subunit D|tara:strand:- start:2481 stop:3098 length:618 start_codon:yes stop_codon:yes gene_type:complete